MSIVKGLVARGNKMYWKLARIEKVSPKTYWVRELQIKPSGEIVELWYSRWDKRHCVPVTEKMLELFKELAVLDDIYRIKHKEIETEHEEYGRPIVQALEEEIEWVRSLSETLGTAEKLSTTTPDASSSG